ncbi:MAG: GNAT family N-acetyltransferase [Nitriliruptorales bacterium]|nr:GNAT family N-acetyltransferase [Nitriliruptorales bacterium]
MLIRRESAGDASAITRVHASAFEVGEGSAKPVEVTLVEELRRSTAWLPQLSLVATVGSEVVGHVVCSRAQVGPKHHPVLGLGPLGVRLDHQKQGLGSALMHAVLGAADACDEPLVGLLGEPGYYGRFGFMPAADHGIEALDVSWGAYFQIRPLWSYTPDLRGRFTYASPFEGL